MSGRGEVVSDAVLVQRIKTVWTKKSRGGRLASLRNAVPEALAVPFEGRRGAAGFVIHEVVYHEADEFGGPLSVSLKEFAGDRLEVGCVTVRLSGDDVVVEYLHSYGGGAPVRRGRGGLAPPRSFALGRGQFGRVIHNGRFSGDEWWYEKVVVNVGGRGRQSPAAFTRGGPAFVIDDTAALW
jgi:hypothetical protein